MLVSYQHSIDVLFPTHMQAGCSLRCGRVGETAALQRQRSDGCLFESYSDCILVPWQNQLRAVVAK